MNNLRQAAQQALEALERASAIMDSEAQKFQDDAITALRAALAEPEQEPVAWVDPKWVDPDTRGWPSDSFEALPIEGWLPLFTAPTPRKPLTDEELEPLLGALPCYDIGNSDLINFARAVIAAYEAKNGITGEQT